MLDEPTVDGVPHALEDVLHVALGDEAQLVEAHVEPLAYDAYLAGRVVQRVAVRVAVGGEVRAWSAIHKWTAPSPVAPAPLVERAHREALAYGSGLLDDLGALRVPRAYRIDVDDAGAVDLWLEEVRDDEPGPWSVATFKRAAEALGEANGRL